MARSRKKPVTTDAETTSPQVHPEGIVHGAAELSREADLPPVVTPMATDQPASEPPAERTFATGFTPNPSNPRRETHADSVTRRLPDKLTLTAGDMKVQMIDAGRNEMGIGIKVVFPEDRKPTDEEKEIIRRHIRGEEGENTGFKWDAGVQMWHKHILREGEHVDDVPASRPVAIRLSAERIVQNLAEALREHSADPVGYGEQVMQRREQAAESSRIPD